MNQKPNKQNRLSIFLRMKEHKKYKRFRVFCKKDSTANTAPCFLVGEGGGDEKSETIWKCFGEIWKFGKI